VLAAGLIGALVWGSRRVPPSDANALATGTRVVAFALPPPTRGAFTQSVEWVPVAAAPNGEAIVYSAVAADRVQRLWLRSIHTADARPIEGSEGATSAFWSPDSRAVAFFAGAKLKRVDVGSSGAPMNICDVPEAIGKMGTWGADGQILFATVQGDGLMRVSASGGQAQVVLKPDASKGEVRVTWPHYLPDGRSFLYMVGSPDDRGAVMFSAADGQRRRIVDVKSSAQYVDPGYLLFVNDGSLVARRFDWTSGTLSGEVTRVADRVAHFRATGLAQFAASRNGLVVFQSHVDEGRIAIFDRSGRESGSLRPVGPGYQTLSLSSDGRRLLFDRLDPAVSALEAWMIDVDRSVETRITNDPRTDAFPTWGPGASMLFSVASGSSPRLFRRDLSTGKEEELSPRGLGLQQPTSVSPDGAWLLYRQRTDRGTFDLMVRRLADNQTVPFRATAADEVDGRFSPDGRLVAYVSDESGQPQIMLASFPAGPSITVSAGAATTPRWRRDGRELSFIAADGVLMVAPISGPPGAPEVGRAARLFTTRTLDGPWGAYEVAPDGRFYAIVRTQIAAQRPMTVILNWMTAGSR
jgi:Tol biopolymer transport system component